MTDRFAHALRLDRISDGTRIDLVADEAERQGIAQRLDLAGIERLEAHAALERDGEKVRARGRLMATLTQCCVVTGDPVPASLDESFDVIFMPEPGAEVRDDEIELDANDCDVVFHDGAAIDLGAAVADSLALALDPYPRSASAEAALKEAGVLTPEEAGPFAALAALKRDLGGGGA